MSTSVAANSSDEEPNSSSPWWRLARRPARCILRVALRSSARRFAAGDAARVRVPRGGCRGGPLSEQKGRRRGSDVLLEVADRRLRGEALEARLQGGPCEERAIESVVIGAVEETCPRVGHASGPRFNGWRAERGFSHTSGRAGERGCPEGRTFRRGGRPGDHERGRESPLRRPGMRTNAEHANSAASERWAAGAARRSGA